MTTNAANAVSAASDNMVLPRVLTACILVPLVATVVWVGSIPYFLFVSLVCLLSVWEYCAMAEQGGYPNQLILSLAGSLLVTFALYLDGVPLGPLRQSPSVPFVLLFWTFLVFAREFARNDKSYSLLRVLTTVGGVVFFGFFLGHLVLIRDLKLVAGEGVQLVGRQLTFFLIVIIWMVDTGAWFVGRLVGKTSLAPRISPKKSWEGSVGGTIIACLFAWFMHEAFLRTVLGPVEAMVYAIIISVTAQMSDLIESLLKRSFNAKDSSQLLPGHGGILDRFDSFVFAAPFYYYTLVATGRFH